MTNATLASTDNANTLATAQAILASEGLTPDQMTPGLLALAGFNPCDVLAGIGITVPLESVAQVHIDGAAALAEAQANNSSAAVISTITKLVGTAVSIAFPPAAPIVAAVEAAIPAITAAPATPPAQ